MNVQRMTAQQLAAQLKHWGVPVLSAVEGDYTEDGEIRVSESVHVQVPSADACYGPLVVREHEGFFFMGVSRSTLRELVHDIGFALQGKALPQR